MSKVVASITTSLDGYITGPNDGPGCGLGEGGERLHYWVFGGPWSYEEEPKGEATGVDKASIGLEHIGVMQSPFATHIQYRVLRDPSADA
jgi:hypothetical protein